MFTQKLNIGLISRVLSLIIVAMVVGLMCGGCKSGKRSVKRNSHHKEQTVRVDVSKIQGDVKLKALVEEALTWVGVPYAYGKSDKQDGTDCSGMVLRVYLDVLDIKLPRNSAKQAEYCKEIKRGEVRPGDLAFFATGSDPDRISHVGIMIDEVNFVHASTKKGVVVSSIDTPYYIRTFRQFGRVPE
ncbi:MAG: C40 family peptidase [Muribaculaceae bacterium]|nr:C40 family peptidase [Muribaculaceae bacterium]